MSDPHDREPVDQDTIDCWRANYGLDKRTPAEAAKWWSDSMRGLAPSGCVAALGVALDELDALRKAAERYRWLRDRAYFDGDEGAATAWCVYGTCAGDAIPTHSEDLDAAIDARMAAALAVGAA